MVFQSSTYSVLLVSGSEKAASALASLLPGTDYWPLVRVGSVNEARRKLLEAPFDLILVNTPLPDGSGVQFATDACSESEAGVLLLVKSERYEDTCATVLPYGVVTLSKPASAQMLTHDLRTLCALRERIRGVKAKQATVEEKIEEIRLMNRAKWRLIEGLHLTEPEAHRRLLRLAMERGCSKREAAEQILRETP